MEMIIIEVTLPAAGKSFEIRLPRAMNCLTAAHLTAEALAPLSGGTYLPSRGSFFAWKDSGKLLNMGRSLFQEKVQNGSRLLLI